MLGNHGLVLVVTTWYQDEERAGESVREYYERVNGGYRGIIGGMGDWGKLERTTRQE